MATLPPPPLRLSPGSSHPPDSPTLPRSPSQLVLVQDPEEHPEFELWQDESEDEEDVENDGGIGQARREEGALPSLDPSTPPISPWLLFPLLLAPTLKLGATLLVQSTSTQELPLPILPAAICLVVLGLLAPLSTQIYLMLGRYVKRWTIESVVGVAVIGMGNVHRQSERQELWKERVVTMTKISVITTSSLLCAAYLRG